MLEISETVRSMIETKIKNNTFPFRIKLTNGRTAVVKYCTLLTGEYPLKGLYQILPHELEYNSFCTMKFTEWDLHGKSRKLDNSFNIDKVI